MDKEYKDKILACKNLNELLDVEYGKVGTPTRDSFDKDAETFCLAQTIREERLRAGLTQEELATKIGTKRAYISRLENGKGDIQLTTFFRIIEGLGKRISLRIY